MQSFRTELENPLVEKDIIDLEKKIRAFNEGTIDAEKFRSLRLARGVYGQRQTGVQMVRIKLPFGRVSVKQLRRIADISDEYSTGNLHLTTRQDIQIHYVSLDKTPELWAKLEQDSITLREACGNTVRNITASPNAGIDADEPFDITPYADAMFKYFLRNPICQELGRKIKIAFSSSSADTALTYMHDVGFIPQILNKEGKEVRGFKVLIGGGLGAQPILAKTAYEFLEEDQIIPFTEALLRVFDRHGERQNRHKARIKYLITKIGLEPFMLLVKEEYLALKSKAYPIETASFALSGELLSVSSGKSNVTISDEVQYKNWTLSNVTKQKQKGYVAVNLRVLLGNISSEESRKLATVVEKYTKDEIRITIDQGFLLRFIKEEALPALYNDLKDLGLAEAGATSAAHITACPGTDTCNLGISSSTGISVALEKLMETEFKDLVFNQDIKIKISGCMNACGQHSMAQIGFHGSSFKVGGKVVPALQLLLGGGTLGNGEGRISEKVIKIPSKRGPAVLRVLLNDYKANKVEAEVFNSFYDRKGKDYFYQLLKPLADSTALSDDELIDWGQEALFQTAIGVGECAGVMIDLVATLLLEAQEKLELATAALNEKAYSDSIYNTYSFFINAAKALLTDKGVNCNTQHMIMDEFEKHFVATQEVVVENGFRAQVLKIRQNEPSEAFAKSYLKEANDFNEKIKKYRSPKEN